MARPNRQERERPIKRAWLKYPLNKLEATLLHSILLRGSKLTKKEEKSLQAFTKALLVFLVGDLHDLPKDHVKKELHPVRHRKHL